MGRTGQLLLLASATSCVTAFSGSPASLSTFSRSVFERSSLSSTRRAGLTMQASKLGKTSTAKEVLDHFNVDLTGKTAVVTGANSGIGLETSKALASVGCKVFAQACAATKQASPTRMCPPPLGLPHLHPVCAAGDYGLSQRRRWQNCSRFRDQDGRGGGVRGARSERRSERA
jgi:hypothetical protein